MVMTRWQPLNRPWTDMGRFRAEVNRLLDSYGREGRGFAATYPLMNVWQDKANIFVEAELPGMDLNDLEILVTGGDQLIIKGERKPPQVEKATWHRQERGFGSFTRALTLPVPVDPDQVEAHLVIGVLSLRLSKSAAALPKKITVKAE
jgi:HSP20 family protein